MWLERYVIVVTSLHRDYLPSSWGMYHGTFWDYATFYGTLGLFLSLMFLFIRFLPVISITEMRELVYESQHEREHPPGPRSPGGRAMSPHPSICRSMACWPNSRSRTIWSRRPAHAYDRGYRMMEAYTPVPGRWVGRGAGVPSEPDCQSRA